MQEGAGGNFDSKVIAGIKISKELSKILIETNSAQSIAELYRQGATLDEIARMYAELDYQRSDRVAINAVWQVIQFAIPDKEERKELGLRHILHAKPGDDLEEKKRAFARMSTEARGHLPVSDEERIFLEQEMANPTNIDSPRHPGKLNYHKIAAKMQEELGVTRPTSTLRRMAMFIRSGEQRTHQGDKAGYSQK